MPLPGQTFPWHTWVYHANTVLDWHSSDSESNFKLHTQDPIKRNFLEKFGWLDCKVHYRFNSHAFRCDEFDNRPCAIALGCSHTQGTGLKEQDTWPVKLTERLGLHVWNLGVSGAAYDTVFRLAQFYIPLLNPRFVFVLEPPRTRFEYKSDNKYKIAAVTNTFPELVDNPYIKHWFLNDENSMLNATRNRLAIAHLSHCHNAKFVHGHGIMNWHDPQDLARDLMHPGALEQQKVVDYMMQQVQK